MVKVFFVFRKLLKNPCVYISARLLLLGGKYAILEAEAEVV
jgi:hypothetical protein